MHQNVEHPLSCQACCQVANAARTPQQTYIAAPAASWLDDFLSWISPQIPRCCRATADGAYCPPPDQPPCSVNATACADCAVCFRASGPPGPDLLSDDRPTLHQVPTQFYTAFSRCIGRLEVAHYLMALAVIIP
jgi:hypothetical protein